jgi:integrase
VDISLERYLDHLFFEGHGIYDARMAVYGTAFSLRINTKDPASLPRARGALTGWRRRLDDASRDPMPQQAWLLALDSLLKSGDPDDRNAAMALAVQFDGYLRPGEVCALTAADIKIAPASQRKQGYPVVTALIAPAPGAPGSGAVPSRRTKAGEQDDTVIFGDAASEKAGRGPVAELLTRLKALRGRTCTPLFNLTLNQYERRCKAAFDRAELQALHLCPHAARHGGPSTDAALTLRDTLAIQSRGRWKAAKSVSRYMKPGRVLRQITKLSAAQLARADVLHTAVWPRLLDVSQGPFVTTSMGLCLCF